MTDNRNVRRRQNRRLCRALAALAFFAAPALAAGLVKGWGIDGEHTTITLDDVQQSSGFTTMILGNASSASITAFTVSHDAVSHTIDYFQTDAGAFKPNTTYHLAIRNSELAGSNRLLHVVAIVFADGRARGSGEDLAFIRGRRLGRVIETERVKSILENHVSLSTGEEDMKEIARKVGILPNSAAETLAGIQGMIVPGLDIQTLSTADKKTADGILLGVRNARQDALWKVNQFARVFASNTGDYPGRDTIFSGLRQLYKGLSGKNRDYLDGGNR